MTRVPMKNNLAENNFALDVSNPQFVKSAPSLKDAPIFSSSVPEYVMLGRSNVGKSSCINALLKRKQLAKTSNTPGKTQLMNFYEIQNPKHHWVLVDLPGYGYAKVSKTKKRLWAEAFELYLKNRDSIALCLVMVDGQIAPQEADLQMVEWLRFHQRPFAVVMTKLDRLPKAQWQKQEKLFRESFSIIEPQEALLSFSAKTGWGVSHVLQLLARHYG